MADYLLETIQSVEKVYNPALHEIIIVDDGSNDKRTLEILDSLTKHTLIRKENGGVASARNEGIQKASGEYLIFLDSDNLLTKGYLTSGIEIMKSHPDIDIVYGESEIFGESQGKINTRPYNLQTLMTYNYIDTCCLVRKRMLDELGGFDENMRDTTGIEDWEMWLRASYHGKKFYYMEGVTIQKYRMLGNSMMRKLNRDKRKRDKALKYLEDKYPSFLNFTEVSDFYFMKFNTQTFGWTAKLYLRKYFPNWYRKLVQKGKLSMYV